jgi:phospholipase C
MSNMKKIAISFLVLCGAAFAQTGQCHSTGNNGSSCTADSQCSGGAAPYCAVLKHIVFIVKENRSFDQFFGRFPGVTGGPVGTASVPYSCSFTSTGVDGSCPSTGVLPAIAANPASGDADCLHDHASALLDINSGAMNQFNKNCAGSSNWANAYGLACSDYLTSGQLCAQNSDCTSGACSQNTLPTYWSYATHYGLADHMFASLVGPSYPNHLYMWSAQSAESINNAAMTAGAPPNGAGQQNWNCDSFHYGRCSNSLSTLCSTNTDCSGGTCQIDQGSGSGYYNSGNSCTKDSDLNFSISSIAGNGTTATATCTTNCGNLLVGAYTQFSGNSVSAFNNGPCSGVVTCRYQVASVTGSPVTSFTFASATNSTGTGGTASYDFCANGNVYQGAKVTMLDMDVYGGSGAAYVPGTCSSNNQLACRCASAFNNETASNPCNDLNSPSACSGSGAQCNPTQNIGSVRGGACPNITTIADLLDTASVTWKSYIENGGELWSAASYISHLRYGADWTNNVKQTTGQFISDATGCTSDTSCPNLPQISWVDTGGPYSEHPNSSITNGQTWTAGIVNAVMNNSYLWKHSVIFVFHDDWGGFYDHLSPTLDSINLTKGPRVPTLCVGAYCTNGIITTPFTFESMLKCVEVQYGLSSLNANDSNANDICTSAGGMVNLALANAPLGTTVTGASQLNKNTALTPGTSVQ